MVAYDFTKTSLSIPLIAAEMKSAAHPDRLSILHLLCNSDKDEFTIQEISESLPLPLPTTEKHLRLMARKGILKKDVRFGKCIYSLNKQNHFTFWIKNLLHDYY